MKIRYLVVAIAVVAGWLAFNAIPASAASIYQRSGGCNPAPCDDNDLVYAGDDGQNNVLITRSGSTYRFEELAPGATITGYYSICSRLSATVVTCPTTWQYPDEFATFDVDAELHDGADQIDMRTTRPARIEGGGGSDVLRGGNAGDTILGDSDFGSNPEPDGADFIDGRAGADFMRGDGANDTVSYASKSSAVRVSLDGVANDGHFGEGDNVQSDIEVIRGTSFGDDLFGNDAANQIFGNEGVDLISGLGGNDELHGGDANDNLDGGDGNDSIFGEGGPDVMAGGANDDLMDGGIDGDRFVGGPGADDMTGGDQSPNAGGPGTDTADYRAYTQPLTVNAGDGLANDGAAGEGDNVRADIEAVLGGWANDRLSMGLPPTFRPQGTLQGGPGNDTLTGGAADDVLEGQEGNDLLDGSYNGDVMNGGAGVDTVDYTTHWFADPYEVHGVASTPDGLANDGNVLDDESRTSETERHYDNVGSDVENVIGSDGADLLVGTPASNRLQGRGSNDTLIGDAAADVLVGGDGDDALRGDAGNDSLDGGGGADDMDGGADVDIATYASRLADLLVRIDNNANDGEIAANERDNVRQTIENVRGGRGADMLVGSSSPNELIGDAGNDSLNGRLGADTLNGQDGVDTIVYSDRNTPVAVTLDETRNDGSDTNGDGTSTATEEGDLDRNIENADGGSGNDILRALTANAVANLLRGFGGDDTLNTRDGTATVDTVDCGGGAADRFGRDPSDAQAGCEIALP
jgi:Ca2+-binding RTX toxin-like protein